MASGVRPRDSRGQRADGGGGGGSDRDSNSLLLDSLPFDTIPTKLRGDALRMTERKRTVSS